MRLSLDHLSASHLAVVSLFRVDASPLLPTECKVSDFAASSETMHSTSEPSPALTLASTQLR